MTTNNHPAHGPISLDRLHQISEILSKASAQSDGGNLGYAMADAVKVIDWAIAAFGAEPVAWLHSDNGIGIPAITRSRNVADSWFSKGWNIKPLYTTPPATVSFPNEVSWEDVPEEITEDDMELALAWAHGFNQCRSAMIQAGNSPVTQNCWIPVSERMPGKLIPVMVIYEDGEMWSAMWNGNRWDDGTEYPDPHSVTHWREMPAAPQQGVKSALEHGMQRYAGAMQKLSEGDK